MRITLHSPDHLRAVSFVTPDAWQHHWQDAHYRFSPRQARRIDRLLAAGWSASDSAHSLDLWVTDSRGQCPHCVGERYHGLRARTVADV